MSRCSVKMTSFWCGEGVGGGIGAGAVRHRGSAAQADGGRREDLAEQAGQFAPLACPRRCGGRQAPALPDGFSVSISAFSSPMVRAAVAWSRISSSAASTSLSGASSRSSTSSSSSAGRCGGNGLRPAPPRCSTSSSRRRFPGARGGGAATGRWPRATMRVAVGGW